MKKIYIASDHAGFKLKESIKKNFSSKFEVLDLGPEHSKKSVNYPDYAHKLSKKMKKGNIYKVRKTSYGIIWFCLNSHWWNIG